MSLEKATIVNTLTEEKIPVLFNPEEYTLNRDNNFAQAAIPGLRAPLLQFVNGNLPTLEMELLFDTYEEHREGNKVLNQAGDDVRKLTRKVTDLMNIDSDTHAPPVLIFTWGPSLSQPASLSFTCVLARASQRFIMFRPDGTPVRARLQVTFNEFTNAEREAKEVNRQTADFSKVHIVGQGETLSGIAGRLYRNPETWRPIAISNGINDPREIAIGQSLRIPSLPFTDPESGEVMS